MPDISMCKGRGCPIKNECYRYRAIPSEFQQTYSDFDKPWCAEGTLDSCCDYQMPIENRPVRPREPNPNV